jgi:hypothetical protein
MRPDKFRFVRSTEALGPTDVWYADSNNCIFRAPL